MQYRNAANVLPLRLLQAVQAYAGGELLYIPTSPDAKTSWGGRNGAQTRYHERNEEIRSRYQSGESYGSLADLYCLSEDSIRKIVRQRAKE